MPNRGMIRSTLMKWCGLRLIWAVNICMKMGTTKMTWNQYVPKQVLNIRLLIPFMAYSLNLSWFEQRITCPTWSAGTKMTLSVSFSKGETGLLPRRMLTCLDFQRCAVGSSPAPLVGAQPLGCKVPVWGTVTGSGLPSHFRFVSNQGFSHISLPQCLWSGRS